MRTYRQITATGAAALALAGAAAAGPPASGKRVKQYASPARVRCDIPRRDYVALKAPRSALAVSFRAVLVRAPAPADAVTPASADAPLTVPAAPAAHAYFQLVTERLGVEQCSISRVALATWDSGYWSLSFRADQNLGGVGNEVVEILPGASVPARAPLILPGSTSPTKYTANIRRNEFTVTIRGLSAFAAADDPDTSPGRPVLFELRPGSFWVQNGVPAFRRFQGVDRQVAAFFADVDRIEVELSYR